MVVEACALSSPLSGRSRNASVEEKVIQGGDEVTAGAAAAAGAGPDGGDASGEIAREMESTAQTGEGTSVAAAAAAGMSGAVTFGGFASGSPWKNMGRAFEGDGGSFLFTFDRAGDDGSSKPAGDQPPFEEDVILGGGGGGSAGDGAGLRVYPWARKDRCFMTSDNGIGLGMGEGGDGGNFGFLLSEDLRSGSTGPCETFQNPPLVPAAELSGGVEGAAGVGPGRGAVFDVLSVEVWGFRAAKAPERLTRIAL